MPNSSPVQILAISLWLMLPGLGWSSWLTAGCALSPLSVLALAMPAGVVLMTWSGFALAFAGVLSPLSVAITWTTILAVGWFFAIRGGGLRDRWQTGCRQVGAAPIVTAIGTLVLIAFAVVRSTFGLERNLAPTALRYWADGLEIADAGGFPAKVLHWGMEIPPTMSKVLLNVLYAQERFIVGREALPALAASLFIVSISLALIVTAFLLEAGIRKLALAVAVVLVGAVMLPGLTLAADLRVLVAEDWGRTLAFAAIVPAVAALRTDDRHQARRLALLAGVLLGTAAGTHLVAALGGAVLIAGLGVGWAIATRWRPVALAVLTVAVVAIAVEGAVLLTAPGELGFQGVASDSGYDTVRQELGKPASFDPVVYLVTEGHPERIVAAPRDPIAVLQTLGRKLTAADERGEDAAGPLPLVAVTALCLASLVVVLLLARERLDLRALGVGSAVALLGFVAITVGFAARFDTFALSNFGTRRLSQYIGFAGLGLLAAAAEASLSRLPHRVSVAAGTIVAVIAAGAILPFARAEPRPTAQSDLSAFSWLRTHVPCEGRVLVNRRTLASLQALSGRAGVLEGMGPHLRPSLLVSAIEEMELAKGFLLHPQDGADYLRSRGIAAVVIAGGEGSRFGGWSEIAETDPTHLAEAPFLHEAYHDDGITIYSVDAGGEGAELPRVRGRIGFAC